MMSSVPLSEVNTASLIINILYQELRRYFEKSLNAAKTGAQCLLFFIVSNLLILFNEPAI